MPPTCTVCELHAESTFKIEGMHCREEVAMLERRFRNLAGLEAFSADLIGERLHVTYDAAKLSASAIAEAVADTGMRAWLEHEEATAGTNRQTRLRQALVIGSGVALALGSIAEILHLPQAVAIGCFVLSLAAAATITIRKAVVAIKIRALDINVLMLIAATGATILGEWSEAATVVF